MASDPFEEFFARGVTDGLPVVPPTTDRVRAAVAASGRAGDELVGLVAPRHGRATVERIALAATPRPARTTPRPDPDAARASRELLAALGERAALVGLALLRVRMADQEDDHLPRIDPG